MFPSQDPRGPYLRPCPLSISQSDVYIGTQAHGRVKRNLLRHYWMAVRATRYPKGSEAIAILDRDRYEAEELAKEGEQAVLDETKQTLSMRVARH